MKASIGNVDRRKAAEQWNALADILRSIGVEVHILPAVEDLEDMVFCANPTFLGIDSLGNRVCLKSHMRFASRQREVAHHALLFSALGYEVEEIKEATAKFEGGGDVLWHPGRRLIWGGIGQRTEAAVYPEIAKRFEVPVCTLNLVDPDFYHLDTCFAALSEDTVLIHPQAFDEAGRELIAKGFENVVHVGKTEALNMACNAAGFFGNTVVIQKGNAKACAAMRALAFEVHEVETSEFMKSGGSVFCLKMAVFE